jgi:hypothetical protein
MSLSPVANEHEICIWAREGLKVKEAILPDADLRLSIIEQVRNIKAAYPKLYTNDALTLSGEDLDAYCQCVGYRAAADWWGSPAAREVRGKTTTVELGGVKETYGDTTSSTLSNDLLARALSALDRISILRPAPRQCTGSPFFGAAGYRKSQDRRRGWF